MIDMDSFPQVFLFYADCTDYFIVQLFSCVRELMMRVLLIFSWCFLEIKSRSPFLSPQKHSLEVVDALVFFTQYLRMNICLLMLLFILVSAGS